MVRPTKAESEELEALERASGRIATAQEAAGILAIRLRQVARRAPALSVLVGAGQVQLTALVDALDDAHGLLSGVLGQKHQDRSQTHWGGTE
jgi:hypothetical protein